MTQWLGNVAFRFLRTKTTDFCARTLIVEPELLILDDALSAVDAKTEEAILSNLKERAKKKPLSLQASFK